MSLFSRLSCVRNNVNKFYPHKTHFILYMKFLSSLSSFKLCNVSLFNAHETFIETDLSHYHCAFASFIHVRSSINHKEGALVIEIPH